MKIIKSCAALLLCLTLTACGGSSDSDQPRQFRGQVSDTAGNLITGVEIALVDEGELAITDNSGVFVINTFIDSGDDDVSFGYGIAPDAPQVEVEGIPAETKVVRVNLIYDAAANTLVADSVVLDNDVTDGDDDFCTVFQIEECNLDVGGGEEVFEEEEDELIVSNVN